MVGVDYVAETTKPPRLLFLPSVARSGLNQTHYCIPVGHGVKCLHSHDLDDALLDQAMRGVSLGRTQFDFNRRANNISSRLRQ